MSFDALSVKTDHATYGSRLKTTCGARGHHHIFNKANDRSRKEIGLVQSVAFLSGTRAGDVGYQRRHFFALHAIGEWRRPGAARGAPDGGRKGPCRRRSSDRGCKQDADGRGKRCRGEVRGRRLPAESKIKPAASCSLADTRSSPARQPDAAMTIE